MADPRAVTFDVWHTMIYLEPEAEEQYLANQLETSARVFAGWPRSPRARHPPVRDSHQAAEEARAEAVEAARRGISMSLASQAIHAARRLGRIPRPLELIRALTALVERTPFRPCPGIVETLEALANRNIRLGVISNTIGEPGDALQRAMEHLGIGGSVGAWAFSDQLPWAKPAPEIFWHCLGMLNASGRRAVHVGDGSADLVGARMAGLRAGILYRGCRRYGESYRRLFASDSAETEPAEFQTDRLVELPGLIDRLLPA